MSNVLHACPLARDLVDRLRRSSRSSEAGSPIAAAVPLATLFVLLVADVSTAEERYSPYAEDRQPNRVFWGDTHLHSSWSPDAGGAGNRVLTPDQAYRFARGETVSGQSPPTGTRGGRP